MSMNEKELAQKFVQYLSDPFELYFEVGGMDIVGICGSIVIAVEVKKFLNFKVIQQAHDNIRRSHYSYVAVPRSSEKSNPFALKICKEFGIGVLSFDDINDNGVSEIVKPKFNRKAFVRYANKLTEDSFYRRTTPGAKSGETITAFSCTVEGLEQYVRRHHGCTIKKALENIDHHYSSFSSAKSCIVKYIDTGVIKTIRREGDKLFLKQ